ncbi:MAG: hypothetical protein QNK42_12775 [Pseudodonghicola sp.]|nr:hypothetical protein [Pseudodonghicola sp.]
MKHIPALIPAAVLMALAPLIGLPQLLGAHPWWAAQVVWIGAPAGLLLALLTARAGVAARVRITLFALIALASFAAASWGKGEFAASFAEDALAGQFWFFGWIGTTTGTAALLAALFSCALPQRVQS